jgi:hypothetical protein
VAGEGPQDRYLRVSGSFRPWVLQITHVCTLKELQRRSRSLQREPDREGILAASPLTRAWALEEHFRAHLCGRHCGRRCRISRLLNAKSSVPPSVRS